MKNKRSIVTIWVCALSRIQLIASSCRCIPQSPGALCSTSPKPSAWIRRHRSRAISQSLFYSTIRGEERGTRGRTQNNISRSHTQFFSTDFRAKLRHNSNCATPPTPCSPPDSSSVMILSDREGHSCHRN